jgi:hypothetical protein
MTLVEAADRLLGTPIESVADKDLAGPSGDRHDFFTIGRYSWPNPDTSDGLPWIRRDCEVNEAAYGPDYELTRAKTMVETVTRLALAYRQTGDERYASNAADRLSSWFCVPATAMNPNLNHAAALPGVHDGVYYGIIQGELFIRIPFAVEAIAGSHEWDVARDEALRGWFRQLVSWLTGSSFGRTQAASEKNNNTAIWDRTQLAVFGHYARAAATADAALDEIQHLLSGQIAADGRLPAELARANSLTYSLYCLTGVATAASIAPDRRTNSARSRARDSHLPA